MASQRSCKALKLWAPLRNSQSIRMIHFFPSKSNTAIKATPEFEPLTLFLGNGVVILLALLKK